MSAKPSAIHASRYESQPTVAEIHAGRILKLDRAAKQDEPASDVDTADFPVEQASV